MHKEEHLVVSYYLHCQVYIKHLRDRHCAKCCHLVARIMLLNNNKIELLGPVLTNWYKGEYMGIKHQTMVSKNLPMGVEIVLSVKY